MLAGYQETILAGWFIGVENTFEGVENAIGVSGSLLRSVEHRISRHFQDDLAACELKESQDGQENT